MSQAAAPSVRRAAQALFPQLQSWRRSIHQQPELGFKEVRTAKLVAGVLRQHGWSVRTGVAKTGVVGTLRLGAGGKTLAIRADMDALPITEQNRTPYCSQVPGVMHACGHDGNTTLALGAAVLLPKYRASLRGTIKLLFQPCEESPPGGAAAMVKAGVLKHPQVDMILAGHMDATLPVGKIAVRTGAVMAAADVFTLTIIGKGGHGAYPHRSVDAVMIAGQVIVGLQALVAREVDPLQPAVVTLGQVQGGTAFNVIAERVTLRGTLRSLTPALRRDLPQRVARMARGICRAYRAECRFQLEPGHPALYNHPLATEAVRVAGKRVLGNRGVVELPYPAMTGEDFTYFAAAVPGCFFRVGGQNAAKGLVHAWHHPRFDFDEQGLVAGTAVMTQTALDYLAV